MQTLRKLSLPNIYTIKFLSQLSNNKSALYKKYCVFLASRLKTACSNTIKKMTENEECENYMLDFVHFNLQNRIKIALGGVFL